MGLDLDNLGPPALRSRVLEAIYQACTEAIEADPATAAAAYRLRGRVSAARGDVEGAREDRRAMFAATAEFIQLPPHDSNTWHEIFERFLHKLPDQTRTSYRRAFDGWYRSPIRIAVGDPLQASADAIEAYVREHHGRKLAMPALTRFYSEAAAAGYPNPMPEVMRRLGGPGVQ